MIDRWRAGSTCSPCGSTSGRARPRSCPAGSRPHLPTCRPAHLPTAGGDPERLLGRWDRLGEKGLLDGYAAASHFRFLTGAPRVAGRVAGPDRLPRTRRGGGPDDERVWSFALAVADPATVCISASASGGLLLDGRTPATEPCEPYLAAFGDWLGLPPEPPSWCWFGPTYVPLVRRAVTGAAPVAGCLLCGGGPCRASRSLPWVPERLRARLDEIDPINRRARRMPHGLRRSAWPFFMSAVGGR